MRRVLIFTVISEFNLVDSKAIINFLSMTKGKITKKVKLPAALIECEHLIEHLKSCKFRPIVDHFIYVDVRLQL